MRQKIRLVTFSLLLMFTLLSKVEVEANEKNKKELFIEKIAPIAQKLAWENDLYASVMIAQACQESGFGTSGLSKSPTNNLFGIKGRYKGQGKTFSTNEDDGAGGLYTIQSTFRSYPSFEASLEDYAINVLKKEIYKKAWKSNTKSYLDTTKHLTGLYASDTNYYKHLNKIIETYDLTKYDVEPTEITTIEVEEVKQTIVLTDVEKNPVVLHEKGVSEHEAKNTYRKRKFVTVKE